MSAFVLPSVRNGKSQLCYPVTRRIRFFTDVYINAKGAEQRAQGRGVPLFEFQLSYPQLPRNERDLINDFFQEVMGGFSIWSLTMGAVTYDNLKFTDDIIKWREEEPNLYTATINARQINNPGFTIPTPPSGLSYPRIHSMTTQRPYGPEWRQLTSVNDQGSGWSYPYHWYGTAFANFPSVSQRRWNLSYPVLQETEYPTIENYFVANYGRYGQFNFLDPEENLVHFPCRFESDVLEITHNSFNNTSISTTIVETTG